MKFKLTACLCLLSMFLSDIFAHDPLGWQSVLIPRFSQRIINGVQVLDQNTIVLVGGYEFNDSLRSIYISDDKGQTWNSVIDTAGKSWLTAVDFVNSSVGFAVGFDGAIIKTTTRGFTWTPKSVPPAVAHRHFNSVFFVNEQIGYVAGGWRTNDSIQTILKTIDGGDTWNIMRDTFGYWLKSIYFTDANNGYAVGEHGVALKTTDGGNSWSQLTLPGNTAQRNFNTVFFIDTNTGFVGGGNKTLDSIQTILKTTDGGGNWNIISDNISPWIRAIYFSTPTNGFAVGDKGTILLSEDTGTTWTPIAIPDTTNDSIRGLYAVNFLNGDFGVAAGQIGKTIIYQAPLPTAPSITTGFATDISTMSATLNGTVNGNGSTTTVTFEYGTTIVLGTSVAAIPGTVTGSTTTPVSVSLSGLDSNTLYYYRVKAVNSNGTSFGVIKQFFAGNNPIPNWDFESWHLKSEFVPSGWASIGANQQVISYDGSFAVELRQSAATEVGAVLYGLPGDGGHIHGGAAFPARPDSLIGYFRYDIVPGDSAAILLNFKKNGVFNSQTLYFITGNTNNAFQRLSFPITYTDSNIPDTVILGITNSTPFAGMTDSNSHLAVDNISFAGTTVNVPNYDFEDWETKTREECTEWTSSGSEAPIGIFTPPVTKTTDRQHGNYAARLENIVVGGSTVGQLETGVERNNNRPVFPVYARPEEFNFYVKYFPENDDSANITLNLYDDSVVVGAAIFFIDSLIDTYTLFSIPISYTAPNVMPDSASIKIESGRNLPGQPPRGASVLYIDNLSFDGLYKGEFSVNAGNNVTICNGDSVAIGGMPAASGGLLPYTYSWSPTATLSDASLANPLAFPSDTTTYRLVVTDADGNIDSSFVTVSVEICNGIHDKSSEGNRITVYPNPAQDKIFIQLNDDGNVPVIVSLFDLSGKQIRENSLQYVQAHNPVMMYIGDVSNGFYLLAIQQGSLRRYAKLSICR